MSKLYNPVTACLKKPMREDTSTGDSDKKNDEKKSPASSPTSGEAPTGWMRSITSGLYNASVGSVKWVATTTYNVGSGVVSTGSSLAQKAVRKESKSKNE